MESFTSSAADQEGSPWLVDEYVPGAGVEIYQVAFPSVLRGKTFKEACAAIYRVFRGTIVLIGLIEEQRGFSEEEKILRRDSAYGGTSGEQNFRVNPSRPPLGSTDGSIGDTTLAIVMAESFLTASLVSTDRYYVHRQPAQSGQAKANKAPGSAATTTGNQRKIDGDLEHTRREDDEHKKRDPRELWNSVASQVREGKFKVRDGGPGSYENSLPPQSPKFVAKVEDDLFSSARRHMETWQPTKRGDGTSRPHVLFVGYPPCVVTACQPFLLRDIQVVWLCPDAEVETPEFIGDIEVEDSVMKTIVGEGMDTYDLERAGVVTAVGALVFESGGIEGLAGLAQSSGRMLTYQSIIEVTKMRSDFTEFMSHVIVHITGYLEPYLMNDLYSSSQRERQGNASVSAEYRKKKNVDAKSWLRDLRKNQRRLETIHNPGNLVLGLEDYHKNDCFASGVGVSMAFFDRILAMSAHAPATIQVLMSFMGRHPDSHSDLECIWVPEELIGKPFQRLFESLLENHDVVTVAAYRGKDPGPAPKHMGNKLPYIYTLPKKDTVMRAGDRVLVLTPWTFKQTRRRKAGTMRIRRSSIGWSLGSMSKKEASVGGRNSVAGWARQGFGKDVRNEPDPAMLALAPVTESKAADEPKAPEASETSNTAAANVVGEQVQTSVVARRPDDAERGAEVVLDAKVGPTLDIGGRPEDSAVHPRTIELSNLTV